MFFLYDNLNTASFFSKTVACKQLDVNDGNDKNPRSHVRSHDNALINNRKSVQCEQVNDFSRAHVGNYFYSIYFISTFPYINISIFFLHVRAYFVIHLFTFNKNKYKNNGLTCERVSKVVHTSFTRSHGG